MNRPQRCVFRFPVLIALAVCAGPAGAARFGDLTVNATSTRSEQWVHGYNEHVFLVANHALGRSHRLTIELPSSTYGNYGLRRLRRTVEVPAGATLQVALPQPPLEIQGPDSAAIFVDGVRQDDTLPVPSLSTSLGGHTTDASVLVSRGIALDELRTCAEAFVPTNTSSYSYGSRPSRGFQFTRAESEPSQWNASWLDYTRFDAVVLGCAEWNAAAAGVRDALIRYTAAGGTLALVGTEPVEDPLRTCFAADRGVELRRGLGRILRFADARPSYWDQGGLRAFVERARESNRRWRALRDGKGNDFPVAGELRVPVRGIYFLLVVFALLIGPVTLRLLARRDRRIWLFWIAPSASLLTCAFIFLHALASEGTRPTIRTEAVTLLDQESRLAVSLATTGFYCPLTPSGGLSFAPAAEVTPLLEHYERGNRAIDCSTRQHFANGWVLSRVPATFLTRSVDIRHERLDCTQTPDGGLRVVNGLGAPIRHLRVTGADGRFYCGGEIAAGGSLALAADAGQATDSRGGLAFPEAAAVSRGVDGLVRLAEDQFFDLRGSAAFTNALAAAKLPQPPAGHYVAVLEGTPFADNALPVPAYRTETTLLLGRLAPEAR